MKGPLKLTVLLTLIAWPLYSQNATVNLPFDVAQRIAIDLEILDHYKRLEPITNERLENYQMQIIVLEGTIKDQRLQSELLEKNIAMLQVQLRSEKAKKRKKTKPLPWLLGIATAGAIGYALGK